MLSVKFMDVENERGQSACENHLNTKGMDHESEGFFTLLPPELRREVFLHISDVQSIVRAMRVNRRWYGELEEVWYLFCKSNRYLDEEEFWREKAGKDWKWVFQCKFNNFKDVEVKEGPGCCENEKGIYEGEWQISQKTGWGKMTWKNGGFYRGHWKENSKEGYGFQRWGSGTKWTGDTYEGQWNKSNREGYGVYIWNTGDKYEGAWQEGRKEGFGTFFFAKSGNRYEGHYCNDARNGEGTFHWANGDVYTGSWKSGEKHGHGTYTWTTGEKYVGEWKHSERTGFGVFTWNSGAKYEGQWYRNRMHGKGTYTWPGGKDRFEGHWINNCRIGHGKLVQTQEDGTELIYHQNWNERKTSPGTSKADIKNLLLEKFPGGVPQSPNSSNNDSMDTSDSESRGLTPSLSMTNVHTNTFHHMASYDNLSYFPQGQTNEDWMDEESEPSY